MKLERWYLMLLWLAISVSAELKQSLPISRTERATNSSTAPFYNYYENLTSTTNPFNPLDSDRNTRIDIIIRGETHYTREPLREINENIITRPKQVYHPTDRSYVGYDRRVNADAYAKYDTYFDNWFTLQHHIAHNPHIDVHNRAEERSREELMLKILGQRYEHLVNQALFRGPIKTSDLPHPIRFGPQQNNSRTEIRPEEYHMERTNPYLRSLTAYNWTEYQIFDLISVECRTYECIEHNCLKHASVAFKSVYGRGSSEHQYFMSCLKSVVGTRLNEAHIGEITLQYSNRFNYSMLLFNQARNIETLRLRHLASDLHSAYQQVSKSECMCSSKVNELQKNQSDVITCTTELENCKTTVRRWSEAYYDMLKKTEEQQLTIINMHRDVNFWKAERIGEYKSNETGIKDCRDSSILDHCADEFYRLFNDTRAVESLQSEIRLLKQTCNETAENTLNQMRRMKESMEIQVSSTKICMAKKESLEIQLHNANVQLVTLNKTYIQTTTENRNTVSNHTSRIEKLFADNERIKLLLNEEKRKIEVLRSELRVKDLKVSELNKQKEQLKKNSDEKETKLNQQIQKLVDVIDEMNKAVIQFSSTGYRMLYDHEEKEVNIKILNSRLPESHVLPRIKYLTCNAIVLNHTANMLYEDAKSCEHLHKISPESMGKDDTYSKKRTRRDLFDAILNSEFVRRLEHNWVDTLSEYDDNDIQYDVFPQNDPTLRDLTDKAELLNLTVVYQRKLFRMCNSRLFYLNATISQILQKHELQKPADGVQLKLVSRFDNVVTPKTKRTVELATTTTTTTTTTSTTSTTTTTPKPSNNNGTKCNGREAEFNNRFRLESCSQKLDECENERINLLRQKRTLFTTMLKCKCSQEFARNLMPPTETNVAGWDVDIIQSKFETIARTITDNTGSEYYDLDYDFDGKAMKEIDYITKYDVSNDTKKRIRWGSLAAVALFLMRIGYSVVTGKRVIPTKIRNKDLHRNDNEKETSFNDGGRKRSNSHGHKQDTDNDADEAMRLRRLLENHKHTLPRMAKKKSPGAAMTAINEPAESMPETIAEDEEMKLLTSKSPAPLPSQSSQSRTIPHRHLRATRPEMQQAPQSQQSRGHQRTMSTFNARTGVYNNTTIDITGGDNMSETYEPIYNLHNEKPQFIPNRKENAKRERLASIQHTEKRF